MDQNIKSIDYVLVTPTTIKVLSDCLPEGKYIGTITIEYPQLKELQQNDGEDADYDEDEQLYSAIMKKSITDKYGLVKIPITMHGDTYLSINVPHFQNTIVYNLFAKKLVEELGAKISKAWITLSPCELSNKETISKFDIGNQESTSQVYSLIPDLKPPHFITGVIASLNSRISLLPVPKLLSIVLRSEGATGFEKVDPDSIMDTCFVLGSLLVGNKDTDKYSSKVSMAVRKINGYANSGMYI